MAKNHRGKSRRRSLDNSRWATKYDLFYPDAKNSLPVQNAVRKALRGESSDEVEVIIEDQETEHKKG
jgi:hypothetical protein